MSPNTIIHIKYFCKILICIFKFKEQMETNETKMAKIKSQLDSIGSYKNSIRNDYQSESFHQLQLKFKKQQKITTDFENKVQADFKNIQAQIEQLNQKDRYCRRQNDKSIDKIVENVNHLENYIENETNQAIEDIKDKAKAVIDGIENKFKTIRTESMLAIGEEFQSQCNNSFNEISDKVQNLKEKLQAQEQTRQQTLQFMITNFGQEIIKVQQNLKQQKQQRMRKNGQLMDLVKRLQKQMDISLQRQINETVAVRIQLQKTLEDLCFRIQSKILGN